MTFELQYNDTKSNARAGLITTDHGVIETPIFMPVGTQGTVKGVHMTELKEDTKAQIILGNTYHLYLRPGIQILEQAGGLHKFNTWDRPILTDSGGFQVFSLSDNRKLHEEGAEFRSHGNAIGGLAVGEPTDKMYEMIEVVNDILPKDKPRYLMGVGTPINLLEGIERGIDMFDCIMPTRNGRNGQLFTRFGTINMRNKKWENDFSPVDPDGHSYVDTLYSKAYLHHLIKAKEMLGLQIASIHNLAFYLWLVKEARAHIIAGDFTTWKSGMVRQLANRL